MKNKQPKEPPLRDKTLRKQIADIISDGWWGAKDISSSLGISEKEVYEHLLHIAHNKGFLVEPPVCKRCGFVFKKRERLKKPSKCPICKGQWISEPLFSLKG